jgi:hypothetical protein
MRVAISQLDVRAWLPKRGKHQVLNDVLTLNAFLLN